MRNLRIYLDNCCFNRPYDDQSQLRIFLEAQAKLYIQEEIKNGKLDFIASYVLQFENHCNPHENRKQGTINFLKNAVDFIGVEFADTVKENADKIISSGVKVKDSYHIACAILGKCDYFISTDDRLLKYSCAEITLVNPVDFVKIREVENV